MGPGKKIRRTGPGILLLAHGSSEPGVETEAKSLLRKLSRAGRERRFYALAWLNRKPFLGDGVDLLIKKGCRNIEILPLLVFRGKHLQQDIPDSIAETHRRHPGLKMALRSHITGMPDFASWFVRASRSQSNVRRKA